MATTIISQTQMNVWGHRRARVFNVTITANHDTLVTGFKTIDWAGVNVGTGNHTDACNLTWSGGTITFHSAGGLTPLNIQVVGK